MTPNFGRRKPQPQGRRPPLHWPCKQSTTSVARLVSLDQPAETDVCHKPQLIFVAHLLQLVAQDDVQRVGDLRAMGRWGETRST